MKKNNLIILITIITIALITGVLVYNPQKRVKGGLRGGPIGPNDSAYRDEYQCFGFKKDFCPSWPDYGCDYLCYGITYGRKCFLEKNTINGLLKVQKECR